MTASRKKLSAAAAAALAFLLAAALVFTGSAAIRSAAVYALYLLAAAVFVATVRRRAPKPLVVPLILFVLAFIYGAVFSFFVRPAGDGDLQFYYYSATAISGNNFCLISLYNAVFPGTVTYPAFLAVFMRLFGVSALVPALINNIAMSAAACAVYFLLKKSIPAHWALAAGLLLALHPYTVIYSATSNAELLFGAITLAAYIVCTKALAAPPKKALPLAALAGALCGLADLFRPLAVIMLIAMLMYILIFSGKKVPARLLTAALLTAAYLPWSLVQGALVKAVTSYDAPSPAYGWNLYVGASEDGVWNESDSAEFAEVMEKSSSATEIQRHFADKAWTRYSEMGLRVIPHSLKKLASWNSGDYISAQVTRQDAAARFDSSGLKGMFNAAVNLIDFPIMLAALLYCVWLALSALRGKPRPMLIPALYIFGSALALMILETAPRYTVSYRILFCVLTVTALYGLWDNLKTKFPFFIKEKNT